MRFTPMRHLLRLFTKIAALSSRQPIRQLSRLICTMTVVIVSCFILIKISIAIVIYHRRVTPHHGPAY